MQEAIERRNPEQTRVPLEDLLVELRPEGFDEAFEADGVDLGVGGLAMRAAILPDVGSRLQCRFQSPHDGRCVDASAEVVWSRDAGASAGEFGLRFDTLDPDDEESIRGLVEAWHAAMGLDVAEPSEHGFVSLKLEGVGQRLDADVVHRAGDVLVVEQGLPFLRLGKSVEEDGRIGRLESVDLRVEGETPRLVLTIGFDRAAEAVEEPVAEPIADGGGDTLMDVAAPVERPVSARVLADEPRIVIPEAAEIVTPRASVDGSEETDDAAVEAAAIARAEARQARRARRDAEAPQVVRATKDEDEVAPSKRPAELARAEAQAALAKSKVAFATVKAWLALAWTKVAPACRAAMARARHGAGSFARRLGPFARVVMGRVRGRAVAPSTKRATAGTARAPRVARRTTTAPGRESRVDESADARPKTKKWLALGALIAIGTGGAIAMAGGDAEAESPASEPAPEAASAAVAASNVPIPADPEQGDVGAPSAPAVVGGPIPAPSFPSLRDGARPSAAPGEVPAGSPYAVDVSAAPSAPAAAPSGDASFGTSGTSGDELRMRMDGPVTALRGERVDQGFRVVISGVRAIDGARRLAAMNPAVERASILNESEGAVLAVRFVAGRSPDFFVRGDGDALVVTVAR